MENDLPKIDIPEDWITGAVANNGILNLYMNFPCRLKAEILVLCLEGYIDASINLTRFHVKPFDFITLLPDSILQIHEVAENLNILFVGYSSEFMATVNITEPLLDILYVIKDNPILSLSEDIAHIYEDFFSLLIKAQKSNRSKKNREVTKHILLSLLYGLGELYKEKIPDKTDMGKSEKISKDFAQLVIKHYTKERSISFYAKKLGITPSHLSTTVKQTTGKTCIEIISGMVIMEAKVQLKSTNMPINEIAYSLNFTNMSFFGKYFKRYVGTGPLEYRNSFPCDDKPPSFD